ncbi:hypothetical protein [Micromonospora sp. AB353]|uniref:hypothetical protein n=1 Tax=Micromonospora sp. AB353 TaxID=3413282 RepID=UPI003C28937E
MAATWSAGAAVRASSLRKGTQRDIDGMRNGMEDANSAVDAALFDLDQHPARDAAAFGKTVEGEIGCLSGPRYRMAERREVHGGRRLDHKSSGKPPLDLLSVQDTALNMGACSRQALARCRPLKKPDATKTTRPHGRDRNSGR